MTIIVTLFLVGLLVVAWMTGAGRSQEQKTRDIEDDGATRAALLQDKVNNCGATALKMVLEHFGCTASLRVIEMRLKMSDRGTSLQNLKDAANTFGVSAGGSRLRIGDLASISHPVIAFLQQKHFIVIDSMSKLGELWVRDPAVGRLKMSQREIAEVWGGEALVFSPSQEQQSHNSQNRAKK